MSFSSQSNVLLTGCAGLEVSLVAGQSAVTAAYSTSPLKLLTPRSHAQSVWAYASSFGGGLLAGDQTSLELRIQPGARCFFSTQATTKVFRNPAELPCSHRTEGVVGENALLVFAPDRVQPFAESSYRQFQTWHLAQGAGLVLLDWFVAGRVARGERWQFNHFGSRNDVYVDAERVFVDSIRLEGSQNLLESAHRVSRFNCFAMLLFLGMPLRAQSQQLLGETSERPVGRRQRIALSASPVRDGVVVRIAGEEIEEVSRGLDALLRPLAAVLGDDPWMRKR